MFTNLKGQVQFKLNDFYENVIHPIEQEEYIRDEYDMDGGYWHYWYTCQCGNKIIPNQRFCDKCGARIDWNLYKYEDYIY